MADRSVMVRLKADIADFKSKMADAAKSTEQFVAKNQAGIDKMANLSLGMGAALVAGAGVVVKTFADFDQQMSSVAATGDDARSSLDSLRQAAIDMGATTAFSATEAAQGIENLLKAGVSAKDVLGGGLSGALDLAASGTMEVGAAAEIAATALTQFGLSGADVPHVADLLAAAAGKAQGEVSDMGAALKQSGLVADQFGLSIEETVGGLAAFASAGLLGSDAGTSLKTMLQRLANPSNEAATAMKDLGIAAYDAQGNFVGLQGLAGQLQSAMTKLTPAQRDAAMATIFGSDAVRAANVLYKEGAGGIAEWVAAVDDQGYAAETAAIKLDNLKGDLEALGGAFESAFISSGSGANDALRGLVQSATDAVNMVGKLPAPVLQGGLAFAGLSGGALLAAGGLAKVLTTSVEAHAAFRQMVPAGSALEGKLKGVAKGAAAIGIAFAAMEVTKAITSLERVTLSAGDAETALTQLGDSSSAANLDAIFAGIDKSVGSFSRGLENMALNLDGFWGVVGKAQTMTGIGPLTEVIQHFEALDAALAKMDAAKAADAFEEISRTAADAGISTEKLAQIFPQYAAALQEAQRESGTAATATEALQAAIAGTGEAAEEAGKSIAELASAMLQLSGSQMGVESAIDAAADSLKEYGKTLDITTEAGRSNRGALDDIATASLTLRDAQVEANATSVEVDAAMAKNRKSFVDTAVQMGMNRGEAELLASSYGLVPTSVTTNVSAPGATLSTQQAIDFKARLDALPAQTQAAIMSIFNSQGYTAALNALNAIDGKTATTYIRTVTLGVNKAVADGGLFDRQGSGLVRAFRDGGVARPIGGMAPGIYPAGGAGILMAEQGAGPWESFISGHPAKRNRSKMIAASTVARLGGEVAWRYADGGTWGSPPAGPAVSGVSVADIRTALDGATLTLDGVDYLSNRTAAKLSTAIRRR